MSVWGLFDTIDNSHKNNSDFGSFKTTWVSPKVLAMLVKFVCYSYTMVLSI